MDPVGPRRFQNLGFLAQPGEVSRQNGRRDGGTRLSHVRTVWMSHF
jgi:hypothetical protein